VNAAWAAAGLSAGAVLVTPLYVWMLARGLKVPIRRVAAEASAPIGASVIMALVVLLVRSAIGAWPLWAQLTTSIGVGAAAFSLTLALLCGRRLLGDLREVLPRRRLAT
jgi:hypothetical protein